PAFEGRGLGTRLIAGALDDIRARGLELIPTCPFVRAYLRRHPEQRDLVVRPSDRRGRCSRAGIPADPGRGRRPDAGKPRGHRREPTVDPLLPGPPRPGALPTLPLREVQPTP